MLKNGFRAPEVSYHRRAWGWARTKIGFGAFLPQNLGAGEGWFAFWAW